MDISLSGGGLSRFDSYSRRARLTPLFLVVAPIVVLCVAVIPQLTAWYRLAPVAVAAGVLFLLDQLGRDRGRKLQDQLWITWGGAPTTVALRHKRNSNDVLRGRRHEQLKALTGRDLPTRRQEQQNPAKADQEYETSVAYLRSRTRNPDEFPLVFKENCNYGFRRNMLGLRPFGLSATLAALIGAAVVLALRGMSVTLISPLGFAAVVLFSLAALVLWRRVVTPDWVKVAADAYADRLLETTETLTPNGP
ncbi:hypothetical protein [Pseudofrankia sp. DC12]|uniref:hypothetical protein n=1 Tax=Pseudofrankia sp. DC12 TaxID=683315 RepID=UPI0005F81399|nr:hypothetical protein [Pseudofrankia sp. DC12]